jgi:N utilization substance protein A
MKYVALPRPELLQIAIQVAQDKGIDKDEVIEAIEIAISKAARQKFGQQYMIRTAIDRKNGAISMVRSQTVVETVEEDGKEISLAAARKLKPDAQLGDELEDEVPPIDFGRIAAQTVKQVMNQKIKDQERARQFNEYHSKAGEIVSGVIRRIEMGNLYVEIPHAEAILRRDDMIPREMFKVGDRMRAYISIVRQEIKGPQIFLSRNHNQFMAKLFAQEVPEVYDGVVEIKAVARDPGSRAKMAVFSNDTTLDPVGACVGMKGMRVQAVITELQGEKIDIIQWTPDIPTFVVNALAPAEVIKVVLNEPVNRIDVVVPDDQLSLAIGRRGQNVRLASQLVGWSIDIMTEAEEQERRKSETKARTELFIAGLDVDDVIAHLLVNEGFTSIEDIAEANLAELTAIEGFDEEIATELQDRAKTYLAGRVEMLEKQMADLQADKALLDLPGMTVDILVKLAENNVKTLDDIGDLATDEMLEITGDLLSKAAADALIMKAREHWFADLDAAADAPSDKTAEPAGV